MKKVVKLGGRSITVDVKSPDEVARSKAPIIALSVKLAQTPWDEHYIPGTKNGYPCSLCSQDCILAPSGQHQHALGQNPIICEDCATKLILDDKGAA